MFLYERESMRKTLVLLAGLLVAFGLGMTVPAHAMPGSHTTGIVIGHVHGGTLALNVKGPHKTGTIMVGGQRKVYTAYTIAWYNSSGDTAYCLDNTANGQNNGTKEQLWQCNFLNQQFWYYIPSSYCGSGCGWHQLENYGNDKCLDDTNGGGNGTQMQTWDCLNDKDQAFSASPVVGTSADNITGPPFNQVSRSVDNYNSRLVNGNKIQVWDTNGGYGQDWCDAAFNSC